MRNIKALAVALLLCLCSICYAQQNGAIDRNLQSLLAENPSEKISVNIVLKSQPEPSRMKAIASNARERKAARSMVVKEFKEYSALKQSVLMDYLDEAVAAGLVSDISCHWLANAITCNAAKEVVEALASHPDVLAIGCNKEFQIVHGFEATGNEAVAMATSHSATPHVLQVNADDVWALGYTGKNVVVAILDSGTNPYHYDLKDHLWSGFADTDGDGEKDDPINGWNFVAGNDDITDDFGHGTHCAGIVCGDGTVGNITGVAPDATLMTVKVVNRAGGGSPAQMMAGVEFAVA